MNNSNSIAHSSQSAYTNRPTYTNRDTYSHRSDRALSPTITALAHSVSASPSSDVHNPTLGFFIHTNYQQMASQMMENPNLTKTCVLLWIILSSWANANFGKGKGFVANASATRLREYFHCADTTLRKSLKALTEEGYLISETDLGSFRRYYRLVPIAPKVAQEPTPSKGTQQNPMASKTYRGPQVSAQQHRPGHPQTHCPHQSQQPQHSTPEHKPPLTSGQHPNPSLASTPTQTPTSTISPTPCQKQQGTPPKMAGINIIRNLNKKITLTLAEKKEKQIPTADSNAQGNHGDHVRVPHAAPSTPYTPPPPQTDSSPVYITYEGNLLTPQDIPRPALPALPEPPVVLGSLFNQQPTESDFEAMKNIMAKANTLETKGFIGKTLAHTDRENVLEPHQRLLCHLAGWAMQQEAFPEPYKACLIALKQDSCIPAAYRRWVKYGVHENDTAHARYRQALEKVQGMATAKPPLPATVLVSLSHYWVNRIQTLIRNFNQPNPKTLLLEIAYHMVHFKPTQICWATEEERLTVNFSLAIRLLKNRAWSTPKGLASLVTRCQEMSGGKVRLFTQRVLDESACKKALD